MKIIACILIFTVFAAGGLKAQAQDVRFRSRAEIDSLLNPPLLQNAETILRFDETVQSVGTLTEDDEPVVRKFVCTNMGSQAVELVRVQTTCSCMTAGYAKGVIPSGGQREITLTYFPKNHPGTVDSNAFVYLSLSPETPVARLTLIGNVIPGADEWGRYPYFMGKLRLKQKQLTLEVEESEVVTGRILCANSGEKPLRLSALMIPEFADFHTEPEVIHPGSEADLVISIRKSMLPANRKASLTFPVVVEGVDGRPSDRTLKIMVKTVSSDNLNKE